MRHLYGIQKTAAQKKQAFFTKLAGFLQETRGIDYIPTPQEAREHVRQMIRKTAMYINPKDVPVQEETNTTPPVQEPPQPWLPQRAPQQPLVPNNPQKANSGLTGAPYYPQSNISAEQIKQWQQRYKTQNQQPAQPIKQAPLGPAQA